MEAARPLTYYFQFLPRYEREHYEKYKKLRVIEDAFHWWWFINHARMGVSHTLDAAYKNELEHSVPRAYVDGEGLSVKSLHSPSFIFKCYTQEYLHKTASAVGEEDSRLFQILNVHPCIRHDRSLYMTFYQFNQHYFMTQTTQWEPIGKDTRHFNRVHFLNRYQQWEELSLK
jgi:hypothetical protein